MKQAKMVSYTFETMPPLTDEGRARLRGLDALADSEIDLSDSPEMTEEQWKSAKRYDLHQRTRAEFTACLDSDVVEWVRSLGEDYEARVNAILRRAMLAAMAGENVAGEGTLDKQREVWAAADADSLRE